MDDRAYLSAMVTLHVLKTKVEDMEATTSWDAFINNEESTGYSVCKQQVIDLINSEILKINEWIKE